MYNEGPQTVILLIIMQWYIIISVTPKNTFLTESPELGIEQNLI